MKFSGYSWDSGTKIYGKHYNLIIHQKKTKEIEWEIKTRSRLQFTMLPLMLLILLDVAFFAMNYLGDQIQSVLSPIFESTASGVDQSGVFNFLQSPPFQQAITFIETNNELLSNIAGMIVLCGLMYLIYDLFKGVRPWHGLEHKLIEAARANDVQNASKFNPISDRCGATYMISGWVAMGIVYLVEYALGFPAPVGVFSIFVIIILVESKYFHSKNHLGIWFGRKLQQYLTISEPNSEMLQIGVPAMEALIQKENGQSP
jgi:uncharacterized protein YqhQ